MILKIVKRKLYVILNAFQSVALGRFCGPEDFRVEGLPDLLILTSDKQERNNRHKDTGYRYRYEFVEFAALWLNKVEPESENYGKLVFFY